MTLIERVLYPRRVRLLKRGLVLGSLLMGFFAIPFEFYLAKQPSTSPQGLIDDMAAIAVALWVLLIAGNSAEPLYDRMMKRRLGKNGPRSGPIG